MVKLPFDIRFSSKYIITIVIGLLVFVTDLVYFRQTPLFMPLVVIALTIAWSAFWIDFFLYKFKQQERESKFPEFVRNLVGAVKSGMPFPRAIIHVSHVDYGALSPLVKRLANKMEWSVPVHKALHSFAKETKSRLIERAITTVIEAEQSGGNIEDVLESITTSLIEIKKMKEKRKASVYGQIVQSYVIFFVFLAIMITVQNFLIPYLMSVQQVQATPLGEEATATPEFSELSAKYTIDFTSFSKFITSVGDWLKSFQGVFLMLSLIQGLFTGLVIGKLSEGDVTAGIKHSLILMTMAFVIISFAQGL